MEFCRKLNKMVNKQRGESLTLLALSGIDSKIEGVRKRLSVHNGRGTSVSKDKIGSGKRGRGKALILKLWRALVEVKQT